MQKAPKKSRCPLHWVGKGMNPPWLLKAAPDRNGAIQDKRIILTKYKISYKYGDERKATLKPLCYCALFLELCAF